LNKLKITLCSLFAGALFYSTIPASQVYAWDSNKDPNVLDTHKMIAEQSVKCVTNDSSSVENIKFKENLDILTKNLTIYKNGSVAPDFGDVGTDRDYKLYQDHFYDPDEDTNFTSNFPYPFYTIDDTAESQVRNYFSQAVAKWKDGNYEGASYDLGKAMHYLSDIAEPHHASNVTAGINSPHVPFESYAEKVKENYKIDTLGYSTSEGEYALSLNYQYFTDFITAQSQKYGKISKDLYYSHAKMSNSWEDWEYAVKKSLTNSQINGASLIYNFLNEVSTDKKIDMPSEIGKFHVVISTTNETYAGTDDYVYFGMELDDGRKFEFNCDVAGDDFEQGYKTSYQFNIQSEDFFNLPQVKNVWIRKAKYIGDDWKIKDLEIYIKGNRVLNKNINEWLSGNSTYNIPVDGLWN